MSDIDKTPSLVVGLHGSDESANTKPGLFWVLLIAGIWSLGWMIAFFVLAQLSKISVWVVLLILAIGSFILVFALPIIAFLVYTQSAHNYQPYGRTTSSFWMTTSHMLTVQMAVFGVTIVALLQLLLLWQFAIRFGGSCCGSVLEFDEEFSATHVTYQFVMYVNGTFGVLMLMLIVMGTTTVTNPECWLSASERITKQITPLYASTY